MVFWICQNSLAKGCDSGQVTEFSQEHRPYDTWWLNQLKCSTVVYVHNFFVVLGLSLTAGLSLWAHVDSYSWCWSIPLDYVGVGVSSGGCICDFSLTANKVLMHKIFKYFYIITHKLISLISHAQPSLHRSTIFCFQIFCNYPFACTLHLGEQHMSSCDVVLMD